ncbi:MAG: ATP-binding protein [Sporichthyaceae bacterium]
MSTDPDPGATVVPLWGSTGESMHYDVGSVDPARTGVDHAQSLVLLEQQTTILELLAGGAALAEVLTAVTLALESHMPDTRCSVLLYDEAAHRMRNGAAPSLPAAYNEAIDGLPVGPRSGSCGTAAHLGQQVVAFDIQTDARWVGYRELAARYDLAACWSSPILDRDGTVLGTFAVYHAEPHVPTRREARLVDRYRDLAAVAISHARLWGALAESEEQFRRAFADNAVGMALLDLQGRFVQVNQAICDLLGRTEANLLGTHFAEVTHPQDVGASVAAFAPLAAGEVSSGHLEKRYLRADGTEVFVDMTASVVRGRDGTPLRISTNIVDLTSRKAAETERRARAEAEIARGAAESASRAKSEFLSTMSHELRTPLSAIVGFSELLETLELTGERRATALGHIGRAARHIMSIVDDVLDLAKIEAGAVVVERMPVLLAPLIREALELLEPMAAERSVAIRLGPVDEALTVLADPRRLAQALLNVLSNAIKYNRERGVLHVGAVRAPWSQSKRALVTVRDTGEGISAELQSRLFTPFDRLGAEARGSAGVGLGLVVTDRLVAAMGGTLELDSHEGVGTTVRIALDAVPAAAVAPPTRTPRPTPSRDRTRGRVLYIEDDAAHRALVGEVLAARPGVELTAVGGGLEGLTALREAPYDLVLLDLDLPDLRGEEVLAAMAADPALAVVPVCVVSGRTPAVTGVRHLPKPLEVRALLATLDELVGTG